MRSSRSSPTPIASPSGSRRPSRCAGPPAGRPPPAGASRRGPKGWGARPPATPRGARDGPGTPFEVAEYEPGRLFALHAVDGPMLLDGRWELASADGATQLHF